MILKYGTEIINANDVGNLLITIEIRNNLSRNTQEKYISIKMESIDVSVIKFLFNDLNLAEKLIEDIKENYKNGTEFYNIETKLKQLAEDNNNED